MPPGERIYVVGDVHGRSDLLDGVARWIEADMVRDNSRCMTIFLGDYVDRGPDSRGVLDRLSSGDFPTEVAALRGNHEEMLLQFLEDETMLDSWRRYGGLETLTSYGVKVADVMRGQNYDVAREELRARIPGRHIEFLEGLGLSAAIGDYFFCHAGVRPGLPLEDQQSSDLLWIRGDFLNFGESFGKRIVHGHTPVEKPDFRPNRINIDTGAFVSGALTCLVLEDERTSVFTSR